MTIRRLAAILTVPVITVLAGLTLLHAGEQPAAVLPDPAEALLRPLEQDEVKEAFCSDEAAVARIEAAVTAGAQRHVAPGGDARRAFVAGQQVALERDLRVLFHRQLLELQKGLAPLLSLDDAFVPESPASCPAMSDAEWQPLASMHADLPRTLEALRRVHPGELRANQKYLQQLFAAVYQIELLREVFVGGAWRDELWPRGGDAGGLKALPYRAGTDELQFVAPEQRLRELYAEAPILSKPAREALGYTLETVGRHLFTGRFLHTGLSCWPGQEVRCSLLADLRPHIERRIEALRADPASLQRPLLARAGDRSPLARMTDEEKLYFLAWMDFFVLDYKQFILEKTAVTPELTPAEEELLLGAARRWNQEIGAAWADSCSDPDGAFLHHLPALPYLYFAAAADPGVRDQRLAAYCDASWVQTPRRKLESQLELFATGAGIAGIAAFSIPVVGPVASGALLAVSAAAQSVSFALRFARGAGELERERAMTHYDRRGTALRQAGNHANLLLVPASAVGIHWFGARLARQGWKVLLPSAISKPFSTDSALYWAFFGVGTWSVYMEQKVNGKNPFGDGLPELLAYVVQNHFDAILFVSTMSIFDDFIKVGRWGAAALKYLEFAAYYGLMSATADHVVHNALFLSNGTELSPEQLEFRLKWLTSGYQLDRLSLMLGLMPLLDTIGGLKAPPNLLYVAKLVPNVAGQYIFTFLSSKTYVRYLNDACDRYSPVPWDWTHLKDFRWPQDLWFSSGEPVTAECEQALAEVRTALAAEGYTPELMDDMRHLARTYLAADQPALAAHLQSTGQALGRLAEARAAALARGE